MPGAKEPPAHHVPQSPDQFIVARSCMVLLSSGHRSARPNGDRLTNELMNIRRLLVILLSPIWLVLVIVSLAVGMAVFSGELPTREIAAALSAETGEGAQLVGLAIRAVLLPFQLIFIAVVVGAALGVFRRRERIAGWVLGEPFAERRAAAAHDDGERPGVLRPERRRTLHQTLASVIAILAIGTALLLVLGQFISRDDLAIVIAALATSLAWGARLPIGDLLGGVSNVLESNLAVGDRIDYRQFENSIDGTVETVDLRFLSVRAHTGELTSIPFGELRVFRNYSRGDTIGIYAIFPVAARDLHRAYDLLTEMAPRAVELIPVLLEPWQPMAPEGMLANIVDISLFGLTTIDQEDDLQLALHALVQEEFAAAGIPLARKGSTAA